HRRSLAGPRPAGPGRWNRVYLGRRHTAAHSPEAVRVPVPAMSHTTRLAPPPTGALHLGNPRTLLVNRPPARRNGWRIILRIEDLDTPRVKPGAIQASVDTLRWLGLDWDSGPIVQSHDLAPYRDSMQALATKALAYPSELTRSEIDAAG